jgi:hypothetical protein
MPKIPEGATVPQDHKVSQAHLVKPEEHPDGWELLRPPIDLEFWEVTEFMALASEVKMRGEVIELNVSTLRTVGKLAKIMQVEFAKNSPAFKDWLKGHGEFTKVAEALLPLIFAYVNALGEVGSSES